MECVHVRALAVKMHRKQCAEFVALPAAQKRFHLNGIEIEGARIDIGKHRTGADARNRAGRREKTEGRGENQISRLHARGGLSQPQSVSAGGATYGIGSPAKSRQFTLESLDLSPQDVMLRGADAAHCSEYLNTHLFVLPLQI